MKRLKRRMSFICRSLISHLSCLGLCDETKKQQLLENI
jgi:hypothetical protein